MVEPSEEVVPQEEAPAKEEGEGDGNEWKPHNLTDAELEDA